MMDATLQDKCLKLIDSKISERRKILEAEIHKINNICTSSPALDEFYQLICGEFRTRSTIVWQCIVKAHKMSGSRYKQTLGDDFNHEFYNHVREAYLELTFKLQSMTRNVKHSVEYKLDDIQAQIVDKYKIEIQVYVDSLTTPQNYKAGD